MSGRRQIPDSERCQELVIKEHSRATPMIQQCALRGYPMPDGSRYCGWHGGSPPKPQRSSDGLPENYDYKDTGCDLHPRCLECPLVQCRYEPGRRGKSQLRQIQLTHLLSQGVTLQDAAKQVGITVRQASRLKGKVA